MAKKKHVDFDIDELLENAREPIECELVDIMNEWGLEYAYATLLDRALVFNYDFVKPVQLRSIWGMYKLGLRPEKGNIKEGTVQSSIMGDYHPHGEESINGVLDGWAQAYNSRVPLCKFTGQPGKFTGDEASAARYLEIGMNKACYELVRDTQQHGCTWTMNEQGDKVMPMFLPARFPLGIINGIQGIATGFSCTIPPHNPDEVMNACIAYLQGKLNSPTKITKYIKGPDFPTGATVIGQDGITDYLQTGKGKFLILGKYNVKETSHGRAEITFTELPYDVSVEQVMTDIIAKKEAGLFAEISEIKDLSDSKYQTDKSEVRLKIFVKAGANIPRLIDNLYKYTRCQVSYNVNTTIIDNFVPKTGISMYEMIEGFINMRKDVIKLRSEYRLKQIDKDLYTLDGLVKVLVDIDKAISIIRNADNSDEACVKLMKTFKIEEGQANQILAMPLRQLTRADTAEAERKQNELVAEKQSIIAMMGNPEAINNVIITELKETCKIISSPRRTEIVGMSLEDLKQQQKDLEKQRRLLAKGVECFINIQDGQINKSIEEVENSQFKVLSDGNIFAINKDGSCKQLDVENIPLDLPQSISTFTNGNEDIAGITVDTNYETLVVSSDGNLNIFKNRFKDGAFCKLDNQELVFARPITEDDRQNKSLIMISKHGEIFKMDLDKLKSVNMGAGLINGTKMSDVVYVNLVSHDDVIRTESNNEVKYTPVEDCPSKGRGAGGYVLHRLKSGDEIISCSTVPLSDEIILTDRGRSGIKKR